MDISTLLGLALAAVLIISGIGMDALGNFWDAGSLLIVIGGTFAALIACYPFRILADIPKSLLVLPRGKQYNIPRMVEQMVDLAMVARQNGLLALEEKANEIKDPFFRRSVLMIVDVSDSEKVRYLLELEMENMSSRHDGIAGLYEKGADFAPSFGMIGTLIGLINMLKNLDTSGSGGGSSNLGADMSVALITTFYGCLLGSGILKPIAKKLRIKQEEEELYCSLIVEGVLSIQAGENPQLLREHLVSALKKSQQKKLLAKAGQGEKGGE